MIKSNTYTAIFVAILCFTLFAGCVWNPDGTLNFEKTWGSSSAEAAAPASLINPGKYVNENNNWFTIEKGAGDAWTVTVQSVEIKHTGDGKEQIQTSETYKGRQEKNSIVCPLYGGDCTLVLSQIDKNTIEGKTSGPLYHYQGTGGGPVFPVGIYKKK